MELKLIILHSKLLNQMRFNRTFMELKSKTTNTLYKDAGF